MNRKNVPFMDTPRREVVNDGQGDPFVIVYTTMKQWNRYKRRANIALSLGTFSILLSASLLFVTIPALSR